MLRQDRLGARLSFSGPFQRVWAEICKTTTLEAERKSEQFSCVFDANCGPDAFLWYIGEEACTRRTGCPSSRIMSSTWFSPSKLGMFSVCFEPNGSWLCEFDVARVPTGEKKEPRKNEALQTLFQKLIRTSSLRPIGLFLGCDTCNFAYSRIKR